jgi:hypothetical protein
MVEALMANDKIFLVCRGCRQPFGLYKHFGRPDLSEYVSGAELGAFIAEHLYHAGTGDGVHLAEPAPFETVTEHVLMKREAWETERQLLWTLPDAEPLP